MDIDFTNLFLQLPALGIFVWYVLKNNAEWRAYLTDRNSKLEKSLEKVAGSLDRIDEHTETNTRVLLRYLQPEETEELTDKKKQ